MTTPEKWDVTTRKGSDGIVQVRQCTYTHTHTHIERERAREGGMDGWR